MFENVRADLREARRWNTGSWLSEFLNPGTQAVLVFRFGHWCSKLRVPIVKHLLLVIYFILDYFVRACLGVSIKAKAEIGPGLIVHTWGGIHVPPIRIGREFVLQHGAMINWNCQGIGDDVVLGPGSKIGPGVRIGSRVRIGPNAVVTRDVPDDTTVVAMPPRMMKMRFQPRAYPGDGKPVGRPSARRDGRVGSGPARDEAPADADPATEETGHRP